jgi:hypothetical protein
MNDIETSVELLFQRVEEYSKTSLQLLHFKAIEKSSDVLSSLLTNLITILVAIMAILFIHIGVAWWIGSLLHHVAYGFFIVGGFYTLVAITMQLFKKSWIKSPLHNSIITQMTKSSIA